MENKFVVFKNKEIRRTLHNKEWWFSVVDVCGAFTYSPDAGAYWRKLKQRLNAEGSEVVTFWHGLKLIDPDGKMRQTYCANIACNTQPGTLLIMIPGLKKIDPVIADEIDNSVFLGKTA